MCLLGFDILLKTCLSTIFRFLDLLNDDENDGNDEDGYN